MKLKHSTAQTGEATVIKQTQSLHLQTTRLGIMLIIIRKTRPSESKVVVFLIDKYRINDRQMEEEEEVGKKRCEDYKAIQSGNEDKVEELPCFCIRKGNKYLLNDGQVGGEGKKVLRASLLT